MRILITGRNGTVGGRLSRRLEQMGHEVTGWDRAKVPIDDYHAMEKFVSSISPDAVYHLAILSVPTGIPDEGWKVNYEWASELAWICRTAEIRFIFSSSVMVFSNRAQGPFTPDAIPDETGGYGYEKRMAEERVRYQYPGAVIARMGWQIGDAPGSNNMIDFLETRMREDGEIRASRLWFPACSFLADTVDVLAGLNRVSTGLYQIDSNRGWSFYEIAEALNRLHGGRWKIVPTDDFIYNQRMIDERTKIPPLSERLSGLREI
jgi:dTDP-4-dehydrorhamnose reductase